MTERERALRKRQDNLAWIPEDLTSFPLPAAVGHDELGSVAAGVGRKASDPPKSVAA